MSTMNPSGCGGSGGSGGGGGPCGACKFLRRKCVSGCIFAPYFDSEQGAAHFAAVHRVFGASNVSKLLLHIPVHKRPDAVITISYEAQARLRDPVYGCVSQIVALQQQVVNLQAELTYLQSHLSGLNLPSPSPLPQQPPLAVAQPPFPMTGLMSQSSMPGITSDLSSLLIDPMSQSSWMTMPQPPMDPRQHGLSSSQSSTNGGDLQALAKELLHRNGPRPAGPSCMPGCDVFPSPPCSK